MAACPASHLCDFRKCQIKGERRVNIVIQVSLNGICLYRIYLLVSICFSLSETVI